MMAAVAGAVAVGVYTTSSDAQAKAEYRAAAPSGAVTLSLTNDDPTVPRMRTTVEEQLPGLGQRADIAQVTYAFCDQCSSDVTFKPDTPGQQNRGLPAYWPATPPRCTTFSACTTPPPRPRWPAARPWSSTPATSRTAR